MALAAPSHSVIGLRSAPTAACSFRPARRPPALQPRHRLRAPAAAASGSQQQPSSGTATAAKEAAITKDYLAWAEQAGIESAKVTQAYFGELRGAKALAPIAADEVRVYGGWGVGRDAGGSTMASLPPGTLQHCSLVVQRPPHTRHRWAFCSTTHNACRSAGSPRCRSLSSARSALLPAGVCDSAQGRCPGGGAQ